MPIEAFQDTHWNLSFTAEDQERAGEALECGKVLHFEQLASPLQDAELQSLSVTCPIKAP